MSTPDISQQAVYQGGNSVFDKVHILDELVYDFTKSGTLSINSVGVCTFTKVNTDQLELSIVMLREYQLLMVIFTLQVLYLIVAVIREHLVKYLHQRGVELIGLLQTLQVLQMQ